MKSPIVVAGLSCLDIIPPKNLISKISEIYPEESKGIMGNQLKFIGPVPEARIDEFRQLLDYSKITLGGIVPNVGGTLHDLGINFGQVTKIGSDDIGKKIYEMYKERNYNTSGISMSGKSTPFTLVGLTEGDRYFLHNPLTDWGNNDIKIRKVKDSKIFLIGYPNLIEGLYRNDAEELEMILRKVVNLGIITMVDFSSFDPDKPSGQMDWNSVLRRLKGYINILIPSCEEGTYIFNRDRYDAIHAERKQDILKTGIEKSFDEYTTYDDVGYITECLLDNDVLVAGVKLGPRGVYLRTPKEIGLPALADWKGKELYFPAFKPEIIKTTVAAGDSFLAGMLYGLVNNTSLEESAKIGLMTACQCLESNGIGNIEEINNRILYGETNGNFLNVWDIAPISRQHGYIYWHMSK
jgi:sugar/nucleoside kinase (ribokinase family)